MRTIALVLLGLAACADDPASPGVDAAGVDAASADAPAFDAAVAADAGEPADAALLDAAPGPDAASAPAGQRLVPAGPFLRGCVGVGCGFDETPARSLSISAFFVDEHEVAQVDYADCVDAAACLAPADHYAASSSQPVRNLTWQSARDYCAFRGGRLPSEAEWEKAMRGVDGREFPWGADPPSCATAVGMGCGGPLAVGGRPEGASPYGVLDGAGNVREWTADRYAADYYQAAPEVDPPGPAEGASRVVRGGGYTSSAAQLRVTARIAADPALNFDDVGFRCVYPVR